jgi:3-hydroxyacyl-[acyl-carrier-protein] dehydratase
MLLGNLYNFKITHQNNNEFGATIEINREHEIFKGHFPEMPVLQGVCQILIVKEMLSHVLNRNFTLRNSKSIKFLAVIEPNKVEQFSATVTYNHTLEKTVSVNAVLFKDTQNFLKMKGEFCETE